MSRIDLSIIGGHRGGTAFTKEALRLLPEPETYGRVSIIDPKEDRAEELARTWRQAGVRATGIKERGEDAIEDINGGSLVLSVDELPPMVAALEKSPLATQWQLLARPGEKAPVVGLSGTVANGDDESREASIRLIKELDMFVPPTTSRTIRADAMNADGLRAMRERVSEHSVRRLQVLDRELQDIPGGTLNLFWGTETLPMMIRERLESATLRETLRMVTETELPVALKYAACFAVTVAGGGGVDIFVVDEMRGRRTVRFHLPLNPAEAVSVRQPPIHSLSRVIREAARNNEILISEFRGALAPPVRRPVKAIRPEGTIKKAAKTAGMTLAVAVVITD